MQLLLSLWQLIEPWMPLRQRGLYEVLAHTSTLELCDPQGKRAIYKKNQRVRFLQNNTIVYQDMAWGDGDIFAEYDCTPGVPVDRYQEGHRWQVLISLRETKNRGDVEEIKTDFASPVLCICKGGCKINLQIIGKR